MATTKRQRPTGESLEDYSGYETWSPTQWAWEFLRRNADFYTECKRVQDEGADQASKRDVARRFGLVRFKSVAQGYSASKPPIFRVASPRAYVRLREADAPGRRVSLQVGELVVRLDLRPALHDKGLIGTQIDALKKIAEERLVEFAVASGLKAPKARRISKPTRKGTKATDIELLRMLDLQFAQRAPQEIMELLFPDELPDKASGNTWDGFFEAVRDRAISMTEHGYLKLVRVAEKSRPLAVPNEKVQ